MYFDADYLEHATLRDGTEVVLRLVQPHDKELLRRGFERLSAESRYRRFFAAKTELSDDELRYLTELDHVRHLAIGASTADGGEGLGVARYIALDGHPGMAEAAVAVVDGVQGKGLGSLLFQRLVAAARERGVEAFRCEVLGSNRGMAELVRTLAPSLSVECEQGVLRMEFPLPGLEPRHPASEPPRETGLFRLMALIAQGAVDWRARWHQLGAFLWPTGHDADAEADAIAAGGHPISTEAAAAIDDPEADGP